MRWQHPELGLLAPAAFLPAAEQTALMRPLTLRVLDIALADCRRWLDDGRTLGVAVNLAVANVIDRGFPADVAACSTAMACRRSCCSWRSPRTS